MWRLKLGLYCPTSNRVDLYKRSTSNRGFKVSNLCFKTAHLVAKWMSVGFTHGVLNTDNLSLASITIDYGPFGFLDSYDPNFIPNHSDDGGRYDYESQPSICLWNLGRLAVALTPILSSKFS